MKQEHAQKRPFIQTPSQTVGPYFAYGLSPAQYGFDLPELFGPTLAGPNCPGEPLLLIGQVFDGQGQPIIDALVLRRGSGKKVTKTQFPEIGSYLSIEETE